jgi:hypothetical protein
MMAGWTALDLWLRVFGRFWVTVVVLDLAWLFLPVGILDFTGFFLLIIVAVGILDLTGLSWLVRFIVPIIVLDFTRFLLLHRLTLFFISLLLLFLFLFFFFFVTLLLFIILSFILYRPLFLLIHSSIFFCFLLGLRLLIRITIKIVIPSRLNHHLWFRPILRLHKIAIQPSITSILLPC